MDQIANLVIDLSIDSAEFRNEVPRIKKLLNDAAGDSERSAARMQRFLDKQTEATRRTSASLEQVTASSTAYSSAVEKSAAASTRLAADVDQTRQRVEALGRKLREEQAQSAAVAAAQDRTSAAFYRQIDSVKQLSGGLQELQRIQAQVRQAKGRGDISQGDYLALVSETARKTRELTDAEALATQKKAQFIRRLKEQTTVQGLSRTELLRVKAAELGVSSAADIYIRKLERTGTATHTLGLKSAAARRELGVLAGELARGNFGALRGSGITLAMGDQQRGRYEERLKIQQHYQEQLEQLKRDSKAKGTYGSDEYRQAEQALKGSLDRRLAEWADYNAKVDAAQGDWTLGASRALDNFLAQGGNVAGMTENVFTNAFNGMADSIANFAVTGKGSFRSLTVSILADLAKMEARIAASKLLGSVLAMFGFGTSAGGSTPSGAYSSAALSVIPNADGGVYRSAGLSQYSGSIVNRPTFFAFAKGAGVMGEAGPEAILPLRRGADGKLGVVAAASGGMAMFAPEYNIEIHNDAGNGQIGPQALQAVYNIGKKAAIDFWQQQSRDGGIAGGGR
ncbi:phage tail tape measure protein [Salmonella enterica]|nr:phage tail tape measure protein [Salmonella enterica]